MRALLVKLNITTRRHSSIGPKIAPSQPSQYIPPAILKPVKYACPPLWTEMQKNNLKKLLQKILALPFDIGVDSWIDETRWKQKVNQNKNNSESKSILYQPKIEKCWYATPICSQKRNCC